MKISRGSHVKLAFCILKLLESSDVCSLIGVWKTYVSGGH
jgi:hypothetical protein